MAAAAAKGKEADTCEESAFMRERGVGDEESSTTLLSPAAEAAGRVSPPLPCVGSELSDGEGYGETGTHPETP